MGGKTKMEEILQSLHENEREEIERANQNYIAQINAGIDNTPDIESKVKLLCNVTGRFFLMRRDWFMASPHNLEIVEPVVTKHWDNIKGKVSSELRSSMLNRCLINADKNIVANFYNYADKILPK